MKNYERPVMIRTEELLRGVYLASGGIKCDSVYHERCVAGADYSIGMAPHADTSKQFGCLGCPANTASGCGLLSHYVDSGYAGSYDVDNGNRKPSWEKKGYGPDDAVTDWNM